MFSTILRKRFCAHNFWTNAARMMILVSRTMFFGLRNQAIYFVLYFVLTISLVWDRWLIKSRLSGLLLRTTSYLNPCAAVTISANHRPLHNCCYANKPLLGSTCILFSYCTIEFHRRNFPYSKQFPAANLHKMYLEHDEYACIWCDFVSVIDPRHFWREKK